MKRLSEYQFDDIRVIDVVRLIDMNSLICVEDENEKETLYLGLCQDFLNDDGFVNPLAERITKSIDGNDSTIFISIYDDK